MITDAVEMIRGSKTRGAFQIDGFIVRNEKSYPVIRTVTCMGKQNLYPLNDAEPK